MGRGEAKTGFWWGNMKERNNFGRPRRRYDNIKIDLQEVGCGSMDWINLAQDRNRWLEPVNAIMNLRVPYNVGNFLTSREPVRFSRKSLLHGISK
jgi:hypothetical protein